MLKEKIKKLPFMIFHDNETYRLIITKNMESYTVAYSSNKRKKTLHESTEVDLETAIDKINEKIKT